MATAPCCPPGSEPQIAATYVPRGKHHNLGDLPVYHIGSGPRAVILCYEVFGLDGGRFRLVSDQLSDAGFNVVLPDFNRTDFFSGDWSTFGDWLKKTPWSKVESDINDKVIPFLEQQGAKKFGILGYCWGNWVVFHASTSGKFSAGVSAHPSAVRISEMLGENLLEMVHNIKCPQLIMSAVNDSADLKPGGKYAEEIKKNFGTSEIVEYKTMNHGWVTRGELTNEDVAKCVKESVLHTISFFEKHLA